MDRKKHNQQGNVLFLILIAVALFAALSYAVSTSSRGTPQGISDEKAEMLAAQILQQAHTISAHVNRMIVGGVPKEKLDFSAANVSYNTANPNCTNNSCRVFTQSGGTLTAVPFARDARAAEASTFSYQSAYSDTNGNIKPFFMMIGVKDVGTTLPEGVLYIGYLDKKVCEKINIAAGVLKKGETSVTVPLGGQGSDYYYWGTPATWPVTTVDFLGSTDNRVAGKPYFCSLSMYSSVGGFLIYTLYPV